MTDNEIVLTAMGFEKCSVYKNTYKKGEISVHTFQVKESNFITAAWNKILNTDTPKGLCMIGKKGSYDASIRVGDSLLGASGEHLMDALYKLLIVYCKHKLKHDSIHN